MENRNILISGASVAGPALAYWLRTLRIQRHHRRASAAPRSGGQAIDLRGTARVVVERMGIPDDIKQAHTGMHGMSVVNSAGKRLVSMGSDTMNGSGGLIAEIEILRGDLRTHPLRGDAQRRRVSLRRLHHQHQAGRRGRTCDLRTRCTPRTFDVVIGADGLHSNVRKRVIRR